MPIFLSFLELCKAGVRAFRQYQGGFVGHGRDFLRRVYTMPIRLVHLGLITIVDDSLRDVVD